MLLDALNPRFAEAQQVPKDDPRLSAQHVEYPSPTGSVTMRGYLVRPAKTPGSCRRARDPREPRAQPPHRGRGAPVSAVAKASWRSHQTASPPSAGHPGDDEDRGRPLFLERRPGPKTREDFAAAAEAAEEAARSRTGRIGRRRVLLRRRGSRTMLGVAAARPRAGRCRFRRGRSRSAEDAANIKAPLLAPRRGRTTRATNAGRPCVRGLALKANSKTWTRRGIHDPALQHWLPQSTRRRADDRTRRPSWRGSASLDFFKNNLKG